MKTLKKNQKFMLFPGTIRSAEYMLNMAIYSSFEGFGQQYQYFYISSSVPLQFLYPRFNTWFSGEIIYYISKCKMNIKNESLLKKLLKMDSQSIKAL